MRRTLLALSCCSIALACAGTPAVDSTPEAPGPTKARAPDAVHAEFSEACQAGCERSRQAQAVAWEMIVAECERQCEESWNADLIVSDEQAAESLGHAIRAIGVIDVEGDAPALLLEKGALMLSSGPAILDLTRFAKARVTLTGTLRTEGDGYALDNVSGVVKLEE